MPTSIENELARQYKLAEWIGERLKVKLSLDRKSTLFISCFDLAIEHHAAIVLLCKAQCYGSMFALWRSIFESCVRGLWLRYSACQEEIVQFEKDKCKVKFNEMITSIEEKFSKVNPDSKLLSLFKNQSWGMMNSFTHSGYQHIVRRNTDSTTGAVNYKPDEVVSVLHSTGMFSLFSAVEIAAHSGNKELFDEVLKKAREYAFKKG